MGYSFGWLMVPTLAQMGSDVKYLLQDVGGCHTLLLAFFANFVMFLVIFQPGETGGTVLFR